MRFLLLIQILLLAACASTTPYLPDNLDGEPQNYWQKSVYDDLQAMAESPLYGSKLEANEKARYRLLVRPFSGPYHTIHLVSYEDGAAVARVHERSFNPYAAAHSERWTKAGPLLSNKVVVSQADFARLEDAISKFDVWYWHYPRSTDGPSLQVACDYGDSYVLEVLDDTGYRYIQERQCKFEVLPEFGNAVNILKSLIPTGETPL